MIPWPNWTTEEWEAKLAGLRGAEFNPAQPRDEKGQWIEADDFEGDQETGPLPPSPKTPWASTVYHGTESPNLNSILKHGLLTSYAGRTYPSYSKPDHTYVTTRLEDAQGWATAHLRDDLEAELAVLEIELPESEKAKLEFDNNFYEASPNREFKGDIKPEWIKGLYIGNQEKADEWVEDIHWEKADISKFKAAEATTTIYVALVWKQKPKVAASYEWLMGLRTAFDASQPRDEYGRWTKEGEGPDESGRADKIGVRTKSDADIKQAILLNEAALFTKGYGDKQKIDLNTWTVEDRLAALRAYDAQPDNSLLYTSSKRYSDDATDKRYSAFTREMKETEASPQTILDEGLKRGLFSLEKKGEMTYGSNSAAPFSATQILGGLTANERARMEDGLIEVTQHRGLSYSFSDLVGAGWTMPDLERFADKLQAAGKRYGTYEAKQQNYTDMDRLAGDLAFYSKDYDNFEAALFNGWAVIGGSPEARVARQISEDLFPLEEGQHFYKLPYEDANYRRSIGMLDQTQFYSPRAVTNMQRLKDSTAEFYKDKFGIDDLKTKPLEVQRALGGHIDAFTPGGLESWTRDSRTVDRFGKLMEKNGAYSALRTKVTYDDVLWSYESAKGRPGWPDDKDLKGKREFVLIGNRIKNVEVDKRYYREKRRY